MESEKCIFHLQEPRGVGHSGTHRYWEQKGGKFWGGREGWSGKVVSAAWPLFLIAWWCWRTFWQLPTPNHLEQAPTAFLAHSLRCKDLPPCLSPHSSLDQTHSSCGAPRCWLWKHQLPLIVPSRVCTLLGGPSHGVPGECDIRGVLRGMRVTCSSRTMRKEGTEKHDI